MKKYAREPFYACRKKREDLTYPPQVGFAKCSKCGCDVVYTVACYELAQREIRVLGIELPRVCDDCVAIMVDEADSTVFMKMPDPDEGTQ